MIGSLIAKMKSSKNLDALNRHDSSTIVNGCSEDVVFVYPGDVKLSGTYKGKEALSTFFKQMFAQFPTVNYKLTDIAVSNPFDLFGNNVIFNRWDVEVVNREGVKMINSGVTVVKLRWTKAYHVEHIFIPVKSFEPHGGRHEA